MSPIRLINMKLQVESMLRWFVLSLTFAFDCKPETSHLLSLQLLLFEFDYMLSLHRMQVFLIGKDFGARIAYLFSLLHSERVSGIITLGVPFVPPSRPAISEHLPEGSYISRWQVQIFCCSYDKD